MQGPEHKKGPVVGLARTALSRTTLGLHAWVGYTDWRHILPAVVGLALWAGGLGLSAEYLRSRA